MSQNRRPLDYRHPDDAQVSQVRRGDGEHAIVVTGYSPGGSALNARPTPGDQKFPFFKDVPDVEGPFGLTDPVDIVADVVQNPIPGPPFVTGNPGVDLAVSREIDVRGIRLLKLFVVYFPDDQGPGAQLILIPQQQLEVPPGYASTPNWITQGVVDSALTSPGTFAQCFAARQIYATELLMDATARTLVDGLGPCIGTYDFDVNTTNVFRVLFGDTFSVTSGLELLYALER